MGETSESIHTRVQAERNIHLTRFVNIESSHMVANASMRVAEIRQFCKLQDGGVALSLSKCQSLIRATMTQLNLSARAYQRTRSVKLARTIADLAGSEDIQSLYLAEALQYRPKLMMGKRNGPISDILDKTNQDSGYNQKILTGIKKL